jgi:hypothetical protein
MSSNSRPPRRSSGDQSGGAVPEHVVDRCEKRGSDRLSEAESIWGLAQLDNDGCDSQMM